MFDRLLLAGRDIEPQAANQLLANFVLQRDDVVEFKVDALLPEDLVSRHVHQLHVDAEHVGGFQITARQDRIDLQLAADGARLDDLVAVFLDSRRRADDQRFERGELGDDAVGEREAEEVDFGVAGQIAERQDRQSPPNRPRQ